MFKKSISDMLAYVVICLQCVMLYYSIVNSKEHSPW
jgi:hypothetical protein